MIRNPSVRYISLVRRKLDSTRIFVGTFALVVLARALIDYIDYIVIRVSHSGKSAISITHPRRRDLVESPSRFYSTARTGTTYIRGTHQHNAVVLQI